MISVFSILVVPEQYLFATYNRTIPLTWQICQICQLCFQAKTMLAVDCAVILIKYSCANFCISPRLGPRVGDPGCSSDQLFCLQTVCVVRRNFLLMDKLLFCYTDCNGKDTALAKWCSWSSYSKIWLTVSVRPSLPSEGVI